MCIVRFDIINHYIIKIPEIHAGAKHVTKLSLRFFIIANNYISHFLCFKFSNYSLTRETRVPSPLVKKKKKKPTTMILSASRHLSIMDKSRSINKAIPHPSNGYNSSRIVNFIITRTIKFSFDTCCYVDAKSKFKQAFRNGGKIKGGNKWHEEYTKNKWECKKHDSRVVTIRGSERTRETP